MPTCNCWHHISTGSQRRSRLWQKKLVGARPLNPNFKPSSSSLSMPSFLSSFFACQGLSNSVYMAICTSKLILDLARLHPDAVTSGTILTASLWGRQGCIYFKRFSKGTKKHHPFRMFQLKRNILYIYNMLVDHDNLVPMRGCPKQQPHSNSQQHAATTNNKYSNLHHLLNRHHVCLTWLSSILVSNSLPVLSDLHQNHKNIATKPPACPSWMNHQISASICNLN